MLNSDKNDEQSKAGIIELFENIKKSNNDIIKCIGVAMYSDELEQLAEILKNKTFSVLKLSYNKINAESMPALQKIILNNPNLIEIGLEYNEINNDAIIALLAGEAIKKRLSTVDLKLACNPISEEAVEAAIPYFSMISMLTMVSGSNITNQKLIDTIETIYRNFINHEGHLAEVKEEIRSAPLRFFDLLPADIQKDKTNIVGQLERKSPTRS